MNVSPTIIRIGFQRRKPAASMAKPVTNKAIDRRLRRAPYKISERGSSVFTDLGHLGPSE